MNYIKHGNQLFLVLLFYYEVQFTTYHELTTNQLISTFSFGGTKVGMSSETSSSITSRASNEYREQRTPPPAFSSQRAGGTAIYRRSRGLSCGPDILLSSEHGEERREGEGGWR